MHSQMFINY
nr:unnamed protein product [Callosobruchus analis]